MLQVIRLITVAIFMCHSTVWAADLSTMFTQKSFVQLLFQRLNWDKGLAKETLDRDYLQILGGKRTYTYEAENAFNEATDRVTVRSFTIYGPFTGKGWIMGVSDSTTADFTTLLPIKGEYILQAIIKGNGFIWNIGDKQFSASSNSDTFKVVEVGKTSLKAGVVKIRVTIPPEGAIDSFSFTAPDVTMIQPMAGWRFKEPLTAAQLSEVVVSLTGRHGQLPESNQSTPQKVTVFESATIPSTAAVTKTEEFGKFNSAEWVRADYHGSEIQIPVKSSTAGYFGITANVMGGHITGSVNEVSFDVLSKPYLSIVQLGLFRLESGDNLIKVNLPPMGGIDALYLSAKSIKPTDFLAISGIPGPPERVISFDEADSTLKSIINSNALIR
ncbi:MAG: hypothetical protein GJV46_08435 [Geobacter sp.]|nr:hypothetical protein [Geobacter sp.]